jgi:hypothetical protein
MTSPIREEKPKKSRIVKNLDRVHAAVVIDKVSPAPGGKPGDLGEAIGELAVKAIMKGLRSPEWKQYMSLFADNEEQLTLLTVERETDSEYAPRDRAYIVANAVCAADTNTFTANKVSEEFGSLLSEEPDDVPGEFRNAAVFDRINNAKL